MSEEVPTKEEVQRVRRYECRVGGHDWEVVLLGSDVPAAVVCSNCGESHDVVQPDPGRCEDPDCSGGWIQVEGSQMSEPCPHPSHRSERERRARAARGGKDRPTGVEGSLPVEDRAAPTETGTVTP